MFPVPPVCVCALSACEYFKCVCSSRGPQLVSPHLLSFPSEAVQRVLKDCATYICCGVPHAARMGALRTQITEIAHLCCLFHRITPENHVNDAEVRLWHLLLPHFRRKWSLLWQLVVQQRANTAVCVSSPSPPLGT